MRADLCAMEYTGRRCAEDSGLCDLDSLAENIVSVVCRCPTPNAVTMTKGPPCEFLLEMSFLVEFDFPSWGFLAKFTCKHPSALEYNLWHVLQSDG